MSQKTNNRLIVPMHLNALLVTGVKGDVLWKDIGLDYKGALDLLEKGIDFNKETLLTEPSKTCPYQSGIHLHWVLPKAFRHGVQTETDTAPRFPFAPNRWLIVRTFYPEADKNNPESRAWIVESDDKKGGNFNWMSISKDEKTLEPFALGKKYNLEEWKENKEGEVPFLTIMAPGNPTFAADYSASKDIFGFHDPLKVKGTEDDLPSGTCSYLVAGWYANPDAEILKGINDQGELKIKMEELSWEIDEAIKDEIPNQVLCHAFTYSIPWAANKQEAPSNIPKQKAKIGVGNSTIEALGVLASDQFSVEQKSIQDGLLTTLQYGLLSKFHSFDGISVLQEQFHDQSFHSIDGGSLWVMEKKEIYNTDENKGVAKPDENKFANNLDIVQPFPSEISGLLKELNEKQEDYDRQLRLLKSLQLELYTLWYRNRASEKGDKIRKEFKGLKNGLVNQIIACKDSIGKLMDPSNKRNSLTTNIEIPEGFMEFKGIIPEKYQTLRNKLDDPEYNKEDAKIQYNGYVIKETKMPVFYIPNDPAITLSGLNPPDIYDSADELNCRIESQLVNKIYYIPNILSENVTVEYPIAGLDVLLDIPENEDLPKEIKPLYQEALLLDPGMAEIMAIQAYTRKGEGFPEKKIPLLVEDIKKSMRGENSAVFKNGENNSFLPSSIFLKKARWKQPWLPLYLEWELNWWPSSSKKSSMDNWSFGEGTDNIDYILQKKKVSNKPYVYRGRIPVNAHLQQRIEDLQQSFPFLQNSFLNGLKPLSQVFDGLNDRFLLRERGTQLPPLKYDVNKKSFCNIDDDLLQLISDQYHYRPILRSKAFFPLRGGEFGIKTIRIIDAFSQVKQITTEEIEENLQVTNSIVREKKEQKTHMQLPIRLLQPARLSFSWMSAAEPYRKTDSDPGTNPVSGWLLPNYLDESLMIFDVAGFSSGSLKLSEGVESQNAKLEWRDTPGMNREDETPLMIEDGPMKKLVEGLLELPEEKVGNVFKDLIKMVYIMNGKIGPKVSRQHATLPIPIGHPIAVVNASIKLELGEIAAQDMDMGLNEIDFPIRLGDMRKKSDGLLGYFSDQNYDKMSLAFANGYVMAGDNDYFNKQQVENLKVFDPASAEIEAELKNYTFLVDPRMDVQVSTGILPTQVLSLPQHWIEEALKNIETSFLVNPLLTPKKETLLPLPDSKEKKWSWITPSQEPGETWKEQELSPKNNMNAIFQPLHITEGWIRMKNKKD